MGFKEEIWVCIICSELENNPRQKAIVLGETDPGYNRCIRTGTSFNELPENFIALFSYWDITDKKLTGDPAKYQVWLPGDCYFLPHPDPGLGLFINCCLPSRSSTTRLNGQKMKDAQCEFKHPRKSLVVPEWMENSPRASSSQWIWRAS